MKQILRFSTIAFVFFALAFTACQPTGEKTDEAPEKQTGIVDGQVEWAKDAVMYEVNVRQFSEEGTINKITENLPRLKKMGVDILWLMPINPISVAKRKGTLGSNYAVSDYKAVNPEFGTKEDFKNLVDKAHQQGMYIMLDWVPNHTGWDHVWLTEHPEYYTKNEKGEITDPIDPKTGEPWGWTDVADLNYDNQEMRAAMVDAMRFWVTDFGIDGYRCDVAHGVPQDFWVDCIDSLKATKSDILMLAEAELERLANDAGFEMTYAWEFKEITNGIAEGKRKPSDLDEYLINDRKKFNKGYHLYFTTNHDENTWHGTVFDRLGDGHLAMSVLACTFDGMPLLYSGQEAPLRKKLEFFEKDAIDWNGYEYSDFYTKLLGVKKVNKALWNGVFGGAPQKIETGKAETTYAFMREKDGDKVVVILNLSDKEQDITLGGEAKYAGEYQNVFTGEKTTIEAGQTMKLARWKYILLSNKY